MIDAKLLATHPASSGGLEVAVMGVWIPRKGDNLRLTLEVPQNYFTNLTAELFHKNYADTGDGTSTGVAFDFQERTGRSTQELLGSKELVRVQLTLVGGPNLPANDVGLVLFRFLQPVWFEAAKV